MPAKLTILGKKFETHAAAPGWEPITVRLKAPLAPSDEIYIAGVIRDFRRARKPYVFLRHAKTKSEPSTVQLCRRNDSDQKL